MLLALFCAQVVELKRGRRQHTYQLDRAVPGAGCKSIFADEVPGRSIDLTTVLMPVLNREIARSTEIVQLDGSITTACDQLVFIQLAPSSVVDGVLCIISTQPVSSFPLFVSLGCHKSYVGRSEGQTTYCFFAMIPFAVRPRI